MPLQAVLFLSLSLSLTLSHTHTHTNTLLLTYYLALVRLNPGMWSSMPEKQKCCTMYWMFKIYFSNAIRYHSMRVFQNSHFQIILLNSTLISLSSTGFLFQWRQNLMGNPVCKGSVLQGVYCTWRARLICWTSSHSQTSCTQTASRLNIQAEH